MKSKTILSSFFLKFKNIYTTFSVVFFFIIYFAACKHTLPFDDNDKEICRKLNFKISVTKSNAILNTPTGSITVSASGGTGFKFSLNGGAYTTNPLFKDLRPFVPYKIVGKNAEGCMDSVEVILESTNPCTGVQVNVTIAKADASPNQNNGYIAITATGGNNFTYSLNGGAFQAANIFKDLAPGTYSIAVKNENGCVGTGQVTIDINDLCSGVTVALNASSVNPTNGQSNGSISVTATGGSGFTYSLNNGPFQSSGIFTNLAPGNYQIIAKNSNGCIGSKVVTLGVTNPCSGVTVTVSASFVNPTNGQSNGSITALAAGGTGFTYSLNNGPFQSSGSFNNLAVGTYTITAKSAAGCLGTKTVTLTSTDPCAAKTITINVVPTPVVPCITPANNGKLEITASGSTGFTYNINGGAFQTSGTFSSLAAGTYAITVKDADGCTKSQSVTLGIAVKGPLFTQMRTLITTRCGGSGCHMNGSSRSGYNFDQDCSIVTKWDAINKSCVTYQLKRMPISPQPIFTAAEKQLVTDWVNKGHKYTD